MSLLDDFAKTCTMLEKRRVDDPEGGWATVWEDGATFRNYASFDTSMEARIAEKEGVTSLYTGLVKKSVPLEYGDYFRDETTGQTFRVTSNPDEKKAPKSSTLDLKFFTAERKVLPT